MLITLTSVLLHGGFKIEWTKISFRMYEIKYLFETLFNIEMSYNFFFYLMVSYWTEVPKIVKRNIL